MRSYRRSDPDARADDAVMSDNRPPAEDGCIGVDNNAVFDGRMPLLTAD